MVKAQPQSRSMRERSEVMRLCSETVLAELGQFGDGSLGDLGPDMPRRQGMELWCSLRPLRPRVLAMTASRKPQTSASRKFQK